MPRYFQSHVTGRALVVSHPSGDRSFIFEPIEPMGGSWLGVLAVDDESAASVLATSEAAWEIGQEKFDALKKKRETPGTAQGFAPSPTPRPPPLAMEGSANPAGRPSSSSGEVAQGDGTANAGTKLPPSVTLLTTNKQPPREPVLELLTPKRRKAA